MCMEVGTVTVSTYRRGVRVGAIPNNVYIEAHVRNSSPTYFVMDMNTFTALTYAYVVVAAFHYLLHVAA